MKQTQAFLSTYTADVSGVCSALFELGGMTVMHDASGCNSTYNTHDEPRWYDMDSLVYISGLSELEAVMGDDEKLISDVSDAARQLHPRFIALAGTPIPMITGCDLPAIAREVAGRTNIPSFAVPSNGIGTYVAGAGQALRLYAERFITSRPEKRKNAVNILGATPLDFAYRIHSAVGNKCVGSKINGRIMPLDTPLETGDRVEIITSASSKGPSADWVRICKTPQAQAKIRAFLKKEYREENIETGRAMVERECRRRGLNPPDVIKPEYYDSILKKYGFTALNDIYSAVGYGGMASVYVVSRLVDEQRTQTAQAAPKAEELLALTEENQPQRKASGKANHGIILPGNEDMDIPVRFGKCCSPVPGDDIVGFITRGRGVTIHKADCVNVLRGEAERRVQVAWADGDTGTGFCVSIKIVAYDHTNLLIELATIIGDANVPIKTVNTELDEKNRIATFRFVLEVKSREQMDKLVKLLQRKTDVIDVFRVQG